MFRGLRMGNTNEKNDFEEKCAEMDRSKNVRKSLEQFAFEFEGCKPLEECENIIVKAMRPLIKNQHAYVNHRKSSTKQSEKIQSAEETTKLGAKHAENIDKETFYDEFVVNNSDNVKYIEQLKKQITDFETKSKEMEKQLNTARANWDKERKEMKHNERILTEMFKTSEADNEKLIKRLSYLERQHEINIKQHIEERDKLNKKMYDIKTRNLYKIDELKYDVKKREFSISAMAEELQQSRKEITDLMSTKEDLTTEISLLKSKRVVNVQILFSQRTTWKNGIEDILMSLLKPKIDSNTLELRFTQCANGEDVKPEIPVIVICVIGPRIGTDIDRGTKGLKLSDNTALVIVHHKEVNALPVQPSDQILQTPEYEQCGGIYDLRYTRSEGIYECAMNANTIISLINFIKERGVTEPMFSDK